MHSLIDMNKFLALILVSISLLACAGASTPGTSTPVESCWALCHDCGLTSHWVWTCQGNPPSVPDGCAWTEHDSTLAIECPDPSDAVPAQCDPLPHDDSIPAAPYLYECHAEQ